MRKLCKALVAVILCVSTVLGVLPTELIGADLARAAELLSASALPETPGFQELLEQLDAGERKTSGVWQYVLFSSQRYAVITGHTDVSMQEMEVPDQLNGADVVGIADGSFAGHNVLNAVTIPGNVLAMGKNAVPAGISIRAVNASYAQTWARKNGHGFQNMSELELRSGVADLSGTRTENFLRVSEREVHLRELEAKRLKAGTIFFLPDPTNLYQISYYKVEHISEPAGGFVTITCSTPRAEDVVTHVSAENETMMPDYSTIRLEPGTEIIGKERRWGETENERKVTASVAIPEINLGDGIKFYLEAELDAGWKTTYDVGLFSDKKVTVVETKSFTVHAGIKDKGRVFESEGSEKTTEKINKWLKKTWSNEGKRKPKAYRKNVMCVSAFSFYGIINVMVNVYFDVEISGKAEISYSNTYTTTYLYENGELERSASSANNGISITGEITGKAGFSGSIEIYVFSIKLASLSVFIGFKAEAKLAMTVDHLGEDTSIINVNMLDCVKITAEAVVEVGASLGLGDIIAAEDSETIWSFSLLPDEYHYHYMDQELDLIGGVWVPGEAKNKRHFAEECPYDWKTVSFVSKDLSGKYQTIQQYVNVLRGATYDLSVSEELSSIIRGYNRKVLGWFTGKTFEADDEVDFPMTVSREDDNQKPTHRIYDKTTIYARTACYRDVQLIDSAGMQLKEFMTTIIRDGQGEDWNGGTATVAGEEQIVLPPHFTRNGKDYTVRKWMEVVSNRNRTVVGEQMDPGVIYTVDGEESKPLYLMAMTDEDIVGRFIVNYARPNETIDVYCEVGGELIAPFVNDTNVSELTGWEVCADNGDAPVVLDTVLPGGVFSTASYSYHEYSFYAKWKRKEIPVCANLSLPGFGSGQTRNMDGDTEETNEAYLTFTNQGTMVTGIREDLEIPVHTLNIPAHRADGTAITGIASNAFKGNNDLYSVYIPNTISSIGSGAFEDCVNLESILMSDSTVTSIPSSFAKGCENLRLVLLPDGIAYLGASAFEGCRSLQSGRLNCSVYPSALKGCTGLQQLQLGGSCNKLLANAFEDCTGLTELEIPYTVNEISSQFIKGCVNLRKLTIAAGITLNRNQLSIGEGSLLEEVVLEEGVAGLGDYTFENDAYGFSHLRKVSLPTTLKTIGQGIFKNTLIEELSFCFPLLLSNSLMTVASYAFSEMPALQTVTITGGTIPFGAFSGNTNLKKVRIESGRIGGFTFGNCTGLETVELGDGVRSIGVRAFQNCTGLTRLEIPDSVTYLSPGFIQGCTNITNLKIGGGIEDLNAAWKESGLTVGTGNNANDTLQNPFYIGPGSRLEILEVGEGVTRLGPYVFANVSYDSYGDNSEKVFGFPCLTKVVLPSSVSSIGSYAFKGSNLTEMELASGAAAGSSVFRDMTSLKRVTVQGGEVGNYAFRGCSGIEEIHLLDGVTGIGIRAFQDCTGLTELEIPDSVTKVSLGMIQGCANLVRLKIGGGVRELNAEWTTGNNSYAVGTGDNARDTLQNPFYIGPGSRLAVLELGEGIETLGRYVFANTSYSDYGSDSTKVFGFPFLTEIRLPSSLTALGPGVFRGSNITELELAPGLASSGSAFAGMKSLRSVTVHGGKIGSQAFSGCTGLEEIVLEDGVTDIGSRAFANCSSLTRLEIPDSVTGLSYGIIWGCGNLTYLKVGGGIAELSANMGKSSANDVYINAPGGGTTLLYNPFCVGAESSLETLELGEGITKLGNYLFANSGYESDQYFGFPNLTKVSLPSTLTELGRNVFSGSRLTEITLSPGLAGGSAFSGITTLKKAVIKGGAIGSYAFSGCTGLEEIVLEEGVTSIGERAFYNCSSLKQLEIPDSVTKVSLGMIQGCTNLTYLKIGGGVADLNGDTGRGANNEIYVPGPNGTNELLYNPFFIGAGSKLDTLVLGEGITRLGNRVFANSSWYYSSGYGFPCLTSVMLPSTLTEIGSHAFGGASLTEVELPAGIVRSDSAFSDMTTLRRAVIKGGSIGYGTFSGCSNLQEVILEEGVTDIGSNAFLNCRGLISLEIPDSVTSYGPGILQNCVNLKTLKIGGGVPELKAAGTDWVYSIPGNYNSAKCTNPFYIGSGSKLETLILGEGITGIGSGTFANGIREDGYSVYARTFPNLQKVVLPSTLREIAQDNMRAWGNVAFLHLPDGITGIQESTVSEGLTLYTHLFNEAVQTFATAKNLTYIFEDRDSLPRYSLIRVVPVNGSAVSGARPGNEAVRVTRGLEGEEIPLGENLVILSTEEVAFTDPVEVDEPVVTEGYAFYGWYTDPEYAERWSLNEMPAANITLYARVTPLIQVKYAVNVAIAGTMDEELPSGFALYRAFRVREHSMLPLTADPTMEGYTFFGWYMDPSFTRNYLPGTVSTENLTIYGRLERNPAGAVYALNSNGTYTLTEYRLMQDEKNEVYIPAKVNGIPVTAIGAYAFTDTRIKTLYLPDTVTEIDRHAFSLSDIHSVTVSKNNPIFTSFGGVIYSRDMSKLIRCPAGRSNAAFTVPLSVRMIGPGAFEGIRALKTIEFNPGLEEIEEGAFQNCVGLKAVSLPDSVVAIRREAFAGCYGMTDFTAYGLMEIGEKAIPTGGTLRGWGPIGDNPLRRCFASDQNDLIGETLGYNLYIVNLYLDGTKSEMFGNEAGTVLNGNLKNITFDDGTQILAWYKDAALGEAWNLDSDLMPAEEINLYASKTPVFSYEPVTLTVGEGTVSGMMLTQYHGQGETLVIPEMYAGRPVIAVGGGFLAGYHGAMTSISIHAGVIQIGDTALINAEGQEFTGAIVCDAGSAAEAWADAKGNETDVRTYRLTLQIDEDRTGSYDIGKGFAQRLNNPERIGAEFTGWFHDEMLQTPAELTDGCFIMPARDTTLYAGWTISEEILNLPFAWKTINEGIMITGYTGGGDAVVIPETIAGLPVNAIGPEAFMGLEIRMIDLGGVSEIGERAFSGCTLLRHIVLPDSVMSLGEDAFSGCAELRRIEIGAGLPAFPASAVENCNKLTSFDVSADNACLASDDGMLMSRDGTRVLLWPKGKRGENITIPDGVTTIADYAFRNAIYPERIILPATVQSIGRDAFTGCQTLQEIQGTGMISIGECAFFGCGSLKTVVFGDALESIGKYAFAGCDGLDGMDIPETTVLDPEIRIFGNETKILITGRLGSSVHAYALARGIMFNDPEADSISAIMIHGASHIMQRGDMMQLMVEMEPESVGTGTSYTWTSSDESVAFVDGRDIVHAISGGEAVLTVSSANGVRATYAIEVQVAVESIELRIGDFMRPEEALMPEVLISPETATNQTIQWTSSDETVAVYDPVTGMIQAVGTGETVITATAHNGLSSSGVVRVYVPIGDVNLTATSGRLFLMDGYNTEQAIVLFEPGQATDQAVTWSSSNPEVATVSETGKITALSAGNVIITASGGNQFGEFWMRQVPIQVIEINHLLRLPAALKTVEDEAFWENSGIDGVILGEHVSRIGEKAFAVMSNLQMVVIPSEEVLISENAFLGDWLVIISPENSDGRRFAEENDLEWLPLNEEE